jgi:outer membrane protein TolC
VATDLAVRLAERQLAGEERKYEVGLSTNFEVLALQEDLATAESNRVAAVTDYAQALAQLRHVQGTLDRA